ncbi:hypothetical protein BpHYR1_044448, partial [Brachionus plicatilis]
RAGWNAARPYRTPFAKRTCSTRRHGVVCACTHIDRLCCCLACGRRRPRAAGLDRRCGRDACRYATLRSTIRTRTRTVHCPRSRDFCWRTLVTWRTGEYERDDDCVWRALSN